MGWKTLTALVAVLGASCVVDAPNVGSTDVPLLLSRAPAFAPRLAHVAPFRVGPGGADGGSGLVTHVGGRYGEPWRLSLDGVEVLRVTPRTTAGERPLALDGSFAVYRDVAPGVDTAVVAGPDSMEWFHVVRRAEEVRFELAVEAAGGLHAPVPFAGGLEWRDEKGPRLRMPAPYAVDARGERRDVQVQWVDGKLVLTLDARALTPPVLVDPAVEAVRWTLAVAPLGIERGAAVWGGHLWVMPYNDDTLWELDGTQWLAHKPKFRPPRANREIAAAGTKLASWDGNGPEVWEYDGAAWTRATPSSGPPPRNQPAFGSLAGKAVAFGGYTFGSGELTDTWEWSSGAWTKKTTATAPVKASLNHQMLEIGGKAYLYAVPQLWSWDGAAWTLAAGSGASIFEDGTLTVVGGKPALVGGGSSDAFVFDGTSWVKTAGVTTESIKKARSGTAGGKTFVVGQNRTWTFDGTTLTPTFEHQMPDAVHALALLGGKLVALGGSAGNQTWEFDGTKWQKKAPATQPPGRQNPAMATLGSKIVLFGGTDSTTFDKLADTWEYDGTTWTKRTPATTPPAREFHAMMGLGSKVVMYGGGGSAGPEHWEWNGTDWTQRTLVPNPGFRYKPTMAVVGTKVLLTGGLFSTSSGAGPFDLWEYDGTAWTARTTAHSPPTALGTNLASFGTRAVLVGGYLVDETWLFDGTDWSRLPSVAGAPDPRVEAHAAVLGGDLFYVGGTPMSGYSFGPETWRMRFGKAQGVACTVDADCASGACSDGVCCNVACKGVCEACNEAGFPGECVPVIGAPRATHPACPTTGAGGPCAASCSGSSRTSCVFAKSGTTCGKVACAKGIATKVGTCDGAGTCSDAPTACAPYACKDETSCASTCATDVDCAATAHCSGGACVPRKVDGTTSKDPAECVSGVVADGVCCNKPCAGACEACDLDATKGTCTPVLGKARHGTCPAPEGGSACAATLCDGVVGASCAGFVGVDVACRPRSCADGVETLPASCAGTGSCPAVETKTCAPFRCDAAACKTRCAADADCVDGFKCDVASGSCLDGATCDGDHTVRGAKGGDVDCTPFRCAGAACRITCATSSDCVAGHACDPGTGQCLPVAEPVDGGGGCTTGGRPGRASGALGLAVAVIAGAFARRRRLVAAALAASAAGCSSEPAPGPAPTDALLAPLRADPEMGGRLRLARPFHPDGGALLASAGAARVRAPRTADGAFGLTGGASVEVSLVGAAPAPVEDHGALVYRDAFPATDAVAVAGEQLLELAWIARDARAPRSFSLRLPSHLLARKDGAAVLLTDGGGATVAAIRPAHARDAAGRRLALVPRLDGTTYTLDLPPDVTFPVAVDPVLETFSWTKLAGFVPVRTKVSAAELSGKVVAVGEGGDTWTYTTAGGWVDTGAHSELVGNGCNDMAALGGKLVRIGDSYATWFFDGSTWSAIGISPAPSPRKCAGVVAVGGKIMLYGGTKVPELTPLDDTWEFDGTKWQQLSPASYPGSDYQPTLLSYGSRALLRANNQTWMWSGTDWALVGAYQTFSASPGVMRNGVPTIVDPAGAGVREWSGSSWVLRGLTTAPLTVKGVSGLGTHLVVFNDGDPSTGTHDTYDFDGTTFTKTSQSALPAFKNVAAWGAGTHVTVAGALGTWEWSGSRWGRRSTTDPNAGIYSATLYGLDDRAAHVDFDARVWKDWDGTSWTARTLSKWPDARTDLASTAFGTKVLLQGGGYFGGSGYVSTAETWECTSAGCAAKTTTVTPTAFRGQMARHGASVTLGRVGPWYYGPIGTVWVWNGSDWAANTPVLEPAAMYHTRFVTLGPRALLYGGATPDPVNDIAWTWSGAAWSKLVPSTPVPAGELVIYGGAPLVVDQGAMWRGALLGAKGGDCTTGGDCLSGLCVDGKCCDGACTGQCEACNVAGKEGTCSPVVGAPVGARTACTATPTACGLSCDGVTRTACALPKAGVACGAAKCKDGIAALPGSCDGAGTCVTGTKTCAPFKCAGDACGAGCTTDYDCDPAAYCDGSTCVAKKKLGEAATEGRTCATGFAADGVCCSSACTGVCEACDLPATTGTCTPRAGAAKHGACPKPASADPCVATTCDGKVGTVCAAYPGPEVSCGTAGCTDGVERRAVACAGTGACPTPETKKCAPYKCGATTCLTACTADDQCAAGNRCKEGKCVSSSTCEGDHFVVSPSGTKTNCAPFRCTDGACLDKCVDSTSCLAGYACDLGTGKCAAASTGPVDDGGCAVGRGPAGTPVAFALAALGLVSALRRRARAGGSTDAGGSRRSR